MTSNVVKFYPAGSANSPDAVLEQAIGQYASVLIVGLDHQGNIDGRASLDIAGEAEAVWLMEQFKHWLLMQNYEETI